MFTTQTRGAFSDKLRAMEPVALTEQDEAALLDAVEEIRELKKKHNAE